MRDMAKWTCKHTRSGTRYWSSTPALCSLMKRIGSLHSKAQRMRCKKRGVIDIVQEYGWQTSLGNCYGCVRPLHLKWTRFMVYHPGPELLGAVVKFGCTCSSLRAEGARSGLINSLSMSQGPQKFEVSLNGVAYQKTPFPLGDFRIQIHTHLFFLSRWP